MKNEFEIDWEDNVQFTSEELTELIRLVATT